MTNLNEVLNYINSRHTKWSELEIINEEIKARKCQNLAKSLMNQPITIITLKK